MIRRGRAKAGDNGLDIEFQTAGAAHLPFADATCGVAICECTLCLLDKDQVVKEMMRVVRPGGCSRYRACASFKGRGREEHYRPHVHPLIGPR